MTRMDPILVVNAGSSSVKFQLFAIEGSTDLSLQIKGQVDGIGTQPRLRARAPGGVDAIDRRFEREQIPDVASALQASAAWLRERYDIAPVAVGHRVVHGGPKFDRPVIIDRDVLSQLDQYASLAPLHQPNNLAPIRSILSRFPNLPQVACFDTAFQRSIESTMGFTALDGLPMGTRPGQLDPGIVLFLIDQMGMSTAAVQTLFYHDCGLKGLSGISNDVRELEASNDQRAAFALECFVYRIGLHAGMLAAALGGVDGFVFTAGIGENSVSLRSRIAEKLQWLGATLDPEANASHGPLISRQNSRVVMYVIPTDEELMIARHTLTLLGNSRKQPN